MKTRVRAPATHRRRELPAREDQLHAVAGARALAARVLHPPPRRDCELDERDQQEGRGVGQESELRPGTRRQGTTDQGPDQEADRARRLDEAVRRAQRPRSREQRHEGELGGLADRGSRSEERGQHQHERDRAAAEGQCGDDDALREGRGDRDRPRLEPVDQQTDVSGEQGDRGPERDQEDGDAEAVPHLVRPQRERQDGHPIADRRDGDRGCDDAEITRLSLHRVEYRTPLYERTFGS